MQRGSCASLRAKAWKNKDPTFESDGMYESSWFPLTSSVELLSIEASFPL
jgi:hypothetical protein